jgi:hypothetical protein
VISRKEAGILDLKLLLIPIHLPSGSINPLFLSKAVCLKRAFSPSPQRFTEVVCRRGYSLRWVTRRRRGRGAPHPAHRARTEGLQSRRPPRRARGCQTCCRAAAPARAVLGFRKLGGQSKCASQNGRPGPKHAALIVVFKLKLACAMADATTVLAGELEAGSCAMGVGSGQLAGPVAGDGQRDVA